MLGIVLATVALRQRQLVLDKIGQFEFASLFARAMQFRTQSISLFARTIQVQIGNTTLFAQMFLFCTRSATLFAAMMRFRTQNVLLKTATLLFQIKTLPFQVIGMEGAIAIFVFEGRSLMFLL
ncbi:MAG TPA: hypothetical protein V6C57_14205 [Coleofasciculaceae cyanobacterium]